MSSSETIRGSEPNDLSLSMTRLLDAPRRLVFEVFTEADHLRQWCAPRGFTITHSEGEVRPGGTWRICMRAPDGTDYWLGGVYREVVADERIVTTHIWEDDKPRHETVVTEDFAAEGNQTRLTFTQGVFKSIESREGHRGGWTETFERLDEYLKQIQQAASQPL